MFENKTPSLFRWYSLLGSVLLIAIGILLLIYVTDITATTPIIWLYDLVIDRPTMSITIVTTVCAIGFLLTLYVQQV